MFKIVGVLLILGSFTAVGISAKQVLAQRIKTLKSFINALEILHSEICQRLTPIPQIINQLCDKRIGKSHEFFKLLNDAIIADDTHSLSYKWNKSINDSFEILGLDENDSRIIADLSSFLGRYDAQEQSRHILYTKKLLISNLKLAQNEMDTKGDVYRTCAIAAGIILVLVLV